MKSIHTTHSPACSVDPLTGRCTTCSDEGLEGEILALRDDALADVELGGRRREIAVDLIDEPRVGDRVLVHAGVAIGRVARRRRQP